VITRKIDLPQAYAHCRDIARHEAKNFYYAFLALPKEKSDAMCAVYAFMRHADDLSDDESISIQDRRARMRYWMEEWHRVCAGAETDSPIFLALRDTQQRFGISDQLLDHLVQGTAMDLEEIATVAVRQTVISAAGTSRQDLLLYRTFNDLYQYCYLVASVVGLVCIRIFGYSDLRADKLAEHTGIAFQLTNILRDVKEDADRGRIYIPVEMLEHYNIGIEEIGLLKTGSQMTASHHALLSALGARAREYYRSAEELLPLIDEDGRPGLWVLVEIYRRLLDRIEAKNYDVFTRRVSIPSIEKIIILARGVMQSIRNRRAKP
jgi:phytoene synthase